MQLAGDLQGHRRGRTPNDDLQILAREGEGASAPVCAGRSHLPLRGKLGWMTPRPGPKKTGSRSAPFGAPVPKQEPQFSYRRRP